MRPSSDRVRHQVEAGIDFVSDGEMSKIGYATYIRHRLSGFEVGDVPRATPADLDAYPRYMKRLADEGGSARYLRPICRGPITYEHPEPLRERPRAAGRARSRASRSQGAFMNAPSPGIIALFQPNEYYPSLDEYLDAIGEAMKTEYEAIVAAGFLLQIDAPDLAMGRHIMYRDRSDEEFVAARGAARRGDQPRAARRPGRPGAPAPVLGQLRGPAPPRHRRRPRSSTWCCARSRPTILFEAANPRHEHEWAAWREARDPRRTRSSSPGVHRHDLQLHRAPRAGRAAASTPTPRSSAPTA